MATIDSYRVAGPGALSIETKVEGDTVRLSAPSLNPIEAVHVSILASSSTTLPADPVVSVRANGVAGVRRVVGTSRTMPVSFFSTFFIASAAVIVMLFLQRILRKGKSGSVQAPGWRNVANVFWLGHDLLWTSNAALNATSERITHGLGQCKHHAGQIGLTETDQYREMDAMFSGVRQLSDTNLNPQWRADFNRRVNGLIAQFGVLVKAQQPDFESSPS